jgi:hypothetical protein
VAGGRCPSVTLPGPVKAVCGARQLRTSTCCGMETELELSRDVGFQISSHCFSSLCSDISDMVGCDARPTVPGGLKSVLPGEQTGAWRCARSGMVTKPLGPGLGARLLLQGISILCLADPVGRLSRVIAVFEKAWAMTGGTSQYVAVQVLVCSIDVAGTMYRRVVASVIHLIRSLVWDCGQDQLFDARVGCIHLQFRCEHPCPSGRWACSEACQGRWGTMPPGPLGAPKGDVCIHNLTHLQSCPVRIPRMFVPGAVCSRMPGDR